MLKSRLPPMDNLIAFEAAARLLSFTRAAGELNITQAAVSQQIRNLEQALGLTLFERAHRAVRLTGAGREYQHTVSATLRHLASATEDIRLAETQPRLAIACDQSFAAMCLVPHLPAFKVQHPDIGFRLIASDDTNECLTEEVQLAILHGTGDWPGFDSQLLFEEEVFPVCSPQYLEHFGPIGDVATLASCNLLNLDDEQWDWMTWRIWFNNKGIDLPLERRNFEVNNYPLLIEAARNGQGIALGWRYLVDGALADGSLVRPVVASVKTDFAYYLAWPSRQERPPELLALHDWITDEFGSSNNIHG